MDITLSIQDQNEFERCEIVIKQGLETFIEVGQALMTIRDKRYYKSIGYLTFEEYCKSKWGMVQQSATRLIRAANTISNLKSEPMGSLPNSERQARPLTKLEPELQREAWNEVVITHGENITAQKVEQVASRYEPINNRYRELKQGNDQHMFNPNPRTNAELLQQAKEETKAHVSYNTGNNEWYTPPEYIESARWVMGSIDLDPASSNIANQTVKADLFFTEQENGLKQSWGGNVWMNPPYSQPLIGEFIEKVTTENITQAIVLVNNATETRWGNMLLSNADAVCFHKSRMKFIAPDGTKGDSPLQGQMIAYLGPNTHRFIKEFSQYGICLCAVK